MPHNPISYTQLSLEYVSNWRHSCSMLSILELSEVNNMISKHEEKVCTVLTCLQGASVLLQPNAKYITHSDLFHTNASAPTWSLIQAQWSGAEATLCAWLIPTVATHFDVVTHDMDTQSVITITDCSRRGWTWIDSLYHFDHGTADGTHMTVPYIWLVRSTIGVYGESSDHYGGTAVTTVGSRYHLGSWISISVSFWNEILLQLNTTLVSYCNCNHIVSYHTIIKVFRIRCEAYCNHNNSI
jgi:hypothetical protein